LRRDEWFSVNDGKHDPPACESQPPASGGSMWANLQFTICEQACGSGVLGLKCGMAVAENQPEKTA
jgi:hypothetical protein